MDKEQEIKMKEELDKRRNQRTERQCFVCGSFMVIRYNSKNDSYFLGCFNWPHCTNTEAIPETMKLEMIGYKKLPGF